MHHRAQTRFPTPILNSGKVDGEVSVSFTIKNTSNRSGAETAEVYASFPPSAEEPPKRFVGWQRAQLNLCESKRVSLKIQPQYLSIFDVDKDEWSPVPGQYKFFVGGRRKTYPYARECA
jgi:beta-glucosidase